MINLMKDIIYKETTLGESLDDIQRIGKLVLEHFYSNEKILERLKGKKYWIYFAKDGEKIVGFKIWYEEDKKGIYSWLGGVDPNYRMQGIATELMELQFKISMEKGYSKVMLKTHKGHPEMLQLLKKKGFKQVKIDQDHWGKGLDAIFFEYTL